MLSRLTEDPQVRNAVNIERVSFGRDPETGEIYDLTPEFPDFQDKIQYAPFLWLAQPYDESTGHHLNPTTMRNPKLNTRQNGKEFSMEPTTTYENLRSWILGNARGTSTFNSRRR